MSTKPPFDCIAQDLETVEEILAERAESEVPLARQVCSYVHTAGGKRLRPTLVLLCARALGCQDANPLYVGAAVEMTHAATLLHDDVVDLAGSRRGTPTVNARWGNRAAVMAGNILLSKSFQILVERGQMEVLKLMSSTMLTMCQGELMQNLHRGDLDITEKTYYEVIRCKTADFLSACCRSGAIVAGEAGAREWGDRLADYGLALGIAFQITDDLLDFVGDEQATGKPLGADLREGKLTLPLILALGAATEPQRRRIEQIARRGQVTHEEFLEVLEVVLRTEADQRAREVARAHLQESLSLLAPLPDTPAKQCLLALSDSVVDRMR